MRQPYVNSWLKDKPSSVSRCFMLKSHKTSVTGNLWLRLFACYRFVEEFTFMMVSLKHTCYITLIAIAIASCTIVFASA